MRYYSKPMDLIRQQLAAEAVILELYLLTLQEIECWRMFGIRAEWYMDELVLQAP